MRNDRWLRGNGYSWLSLVAAVLLLINFSGLAWGDDYRFKRMWPNLPQPWYFHFPRAVAVDKQGNVYVADEAKNRILIFTSNGEFFGKWGRFGSGDGEFQYSFYIAVDSNRNVYVADTGNDRVQKFSSDGQLLRMWGKYGTGDGEFRDPQGIAADGSGNVYVADAENFRIQKFSSNGQFTGKWGIYGCGNYPGGLALDSSGNVYVADLWCIQKFTSGGEFRGKWGSFGSSHDQVHQPQGIAVSPNGDVYVADTVNSRIQVFEPTPPQPSTSKVIILAGGGPYWGNYLWDATQMVSNLAFRSLRYQGFAKNQVRYLTSNTQQDLDENGFFDDLLPATKLSLKEAITVWAREEKTDQLVLYLTDHGNEGTFRINGSDGDDGILTAGELGSWLDDLTGTQVVVVDDSCFAGSFLKPLSGNNRVVISSTSPNEKAMFGFSGSLSFSNYFWSQVFNGGSLYKAFTTASKAVKFGSEGTGNPQTPQVDADGDGVANTSKDLDALRGLDVVRGTQSFNKVPTIKAASADPSPVPAGGNSATIRATGVKDADGIQRVWAVIWPPGFTSEGSNPITDLPHVDLKLKADTEDEYEASYGGFSRKGTYHVLVYAMDRKTTASLPKLVKVDVESPLTEKAILVAGGSVGTPSLWEGTAYNLEHAYNTLIQQNYDPGDIRVLSPSPLDDVPVYGSATAEAIRLAIQEWAVVGTQNLLLYLVGPGEPEAFKLSGTEKLSAGDLGLWLEGLQSEVPGKIIVIYDGDYSGSFLPHLQGRDRIVIAGSRADQGACLANGGLSSFSQVFWTQVRSGVNVWKAFWEGKVINGIIAKGQSAQLDDDGDGNYTGLDSPRAERFRIGMGFSLGSDPPIIGAKCPDRKIKTGNSATIWVKNVTTTGSLEKVWAVVVPPDYDPTGKTSADADFPKVTLKKQSTGRYQAVYRKFTKPGQYLVTVFASDKEGNVSLPAVIQVSR